jgi:hypothetical protein
MLPLHIYSMMAENIDAFALIASAVCLVVYHVVYVVETTAESTQLRSSRQRSLMDLWVSKHLPVNDDINKYPVVAIQLIRNSLYCAIFIGGYTLSSSFRIITSISRIHQPSSIGAIAIATCLLGSFLCWAKVIRNLVHLSYAIGSWNPTIEPYSGAEGINHPHITKWGHKAPGSVGSFSAAEEAGLDDEGSMEAGVSAGAVRTDAGSNTGIGRSRGVSEDPNAAFLTRERHYDFGCILARDSGLYFSFAFKFLYISIPYSFYVSFGAIALLVVTVIVLALEVLWDYGYAISSHFKAQHSSSAQLSVPAAGDTPKELQLSEGDTHQ